MKTLLGRILAFLFILLALASVGSACTITIGPYDDTGGTAPPKTSVLPDPQGGPVDEPPLDEGQQARLEETEWYTRSVIYKGGEILHSIQLPSGDIVDFIKRDTLPGLPYEPPKLELPQGVGFGLTELEQLPELAELLANAVPYLRPTFWPYILGDAPDATSIEDYLASYQVGGHGDGTEGGQPSGVKRLYAGLDSPIPNRGVFGYMNQFRPKVDNLGTEMGSGNFPEAGMPNIAYVRYPMYYNLSWVPEEPLDDYHAQPFQPLCYGRAPLTDGILAFGGPGGFNSACKWP
jgi:hypothetical protein